MKVRALKKGSKQDWFFILRMLKICEIKYTAFFVPILFSLFAAALEGLSLSLLAPALDVAVQGVVDAKKQSWLVQQLQSLVSYFTEIDSKALLGFLVAMIFVSETFKYFSSYLSSVQITSLVHRFSHSIRVKLFSAYLGFGKLYFDSNSRGEMYQVLTTNTRIIGTSLRTTNQALSQLITLVVYVFMMFVISWQLTLITLLVFPALHYLAESRISRIRNVSMAMSKSTSLLGRRISNALASIPLVKIYGTEEQEQRIFQEVSESINNSENEIDRLTLMLEPLRDFVVLVCIALLVGFIWLVSAATNAVGVGKYLVFILLLKRSTRFFGALNSTRANFAEIYGPLAQVQKILFGEHENYAVTSGTKVFNKLLAPLEIRNLSFSYPDKSMSLNEVSMTINPGKVLAIVGRSGAGKSTLINLLARFYQSPNNSIFVNGEDLRNYSLRSWSNKIALVGQDSFLFYASLKDNLSYGLDSVTVPQLCDVLERAGLSDFVSTLPEGINTIIGDGGIKLSGGEKQRLSLARAFLRDPEIVILDEPTSALDSQTEQELQKEIDTLCKGKTVIIIAHRLATVKHADWIVVMESGKIVQQGTLSDLIGSSGEFRKYWDAQQLPS